MRTFMEEIEKPVLPLWKECLRTNFIMELKSGELSEERFQRYLEQDSFYLLAYTRLCAKAIVNAKSEEEVKIYASMIAYVNGTELVTREEEKEEKKEGLLLPAARRYIDYLMEVYKDGDNDRIFLVLVNCMLSYDYIFTKLAEEMKKEDKYWFFVKDYASPEYRAFCDRWIAFMNKKYEKKGKEEKEEYFEILRKACSLEYDFWEMAYHGK